MFRKMGSLFDGSRGGKGFYIVLCLCALVVGSSSWLLLSGAGTDVEDEVYQETAGSVTGDIGPDYEPESLPVMAPESTPVSDSPTDAQESVQTQDYLWPVDGEISRSYAMESLQYDRTMADWRSHDGVDIACADGTSVLASADGMVVRVWKDDLLGTCVELAHEGGVNTVYANLAPNVTVSAEQAVTRGQELGVVGGSALAEAAEVSHLHFAVTQNGLSADPQDYLW